MIMYACPPINTRLNNIRTVFTSIYKNRVFYRDFMKINSNMLSDNNYYGGKWFCEEFNLYAGYGFVERQFCTDCTVEQKQI